MAKTDNSFVRRVSLALASGDGLTSRSIALDLAEIVDELLVVVAGCSEHPGYRAVKRPRVPCAGCERVMKARWKAEGMLSRMGVRDG